MRTHKRLLRVCALTACAVLAMAAVGRAAVVTSRLGTGLPPQSPREDLPQCWAAAVDEAPTIDGRLDEKAWTATPPGQRSSWTNTSLADGKVIQSGVVSADQFGLVTMENLIISKSENRIRLIR